MSVATPHEQEVKELFEKASVELPGSTELRVMSLDSFKTAINRMMNEAYYYGQMEGLRTAEGIVDGTFKK